MHCNDQSDSNDAANHPATNLITVTFGKVDKGTVYVLTPEYNARLYIYSAEGKQVYEKSFDGTFYRYAVDISGFGKGLYHLTLIANDQIYKAKFLKE